jgi:endonuclease YncB( thermonuclease family)
MQFARRHDTHLSEMNHARFRPMAEVPVRFVALAVFALVSSTAHADTIAGRASVIDADTLQINGERIRIRDIDAPEKDQFCQQAVGDVTWECGIEATFALIDWIGEADVVCETDRLDRYKRHLARCTVEGEDLAVWLAESGWGVPFRDCKCEAVREASTRAQAEGRGIWIGPFVLPWEWRAAH